MKKICHSKRGFTLIELLIVIAVLGILITGLIVIINPMQQIGKARDAQRKNTLKQLQNALEQYYNDNKSYPVTPGGYYSSEPGDVVSNNNGNWIPGLAATTKYINALPRDPSGGNSVLTACASSWKKAYLYKSDDGQSYALLSHCSWEGVTTGDSKSGLYDSVRPNWALSLIHI